MTKTLVKLRFAPYAGTRCEWREINAKVCGDLAVHRPAYVLPEREGGALSVSNRDWTISHIPSGDSVAQALPQRFRNRGAIVATQRDLLAWAEAFQDACPDFFAATRDLNAEGNRDKAASLAPEALRIGHSL